MLTVVACARCATLNRAGANYCRKCGGEIAEPDLAVLTGTQQNADSFAMRGRFRRPPLLCNGLLYALETGGRLISLAPRSGAQQVTEGQPLSSQAGFNRGAMVEATGSSRGLRGYLFVAVSPTSLEAMQPGTGRVTELYRPQENESIVANSSEADSTGLKGVAATRDLCGIAVRTGSGEIALMLVYFSKDRQVEQALKIRGTDVCGPTLCGRYLVLCSDEAVGVYDLRSSQAHIAELPDNFHPMMARENRGIDIAPGDIPLAALDGEGGPQVWIAGYQAESGRRGAPTRPGLLQVSFPSRRVEFRQDWADGRFSMRSLPDGSFYVSTANGVKFPGQLHEGERRESIKGGMPVSLDHGRMTFFRPDPQVGWHEIAVVTPDAVGTAYFADTEDECNADSCCPILVDGRDVVVPYLKTSSSLTAEGLKFAHWRFS